MAEKKDAPSEENKEPMDKFLEEYQSKIREQLDPDFQTEGSEKLISKEYVEFKTQYLPKHLTFYEKACNLSEKILRLKPDSKKKRALKNLYQFAT